MSTYREVNHTTMGEGDLHLGTPTSVMEADFKSPEQIQLQSDPMKKQDAGNKRGGTGSVKQRKAGRMAFVSVLCLG